MRNEEAIRRRAKTDRELHSYVVGTSPYQTRSGAATTQRWPFPSRIITAEGKCCRQPVDDETLLRMRVRFGVELLEVDETLKHNEYWMFQSYMRELDKLIATLQLKGKVVDHSGVVHEFPVAALIANGCLHGQLVSQLVLEALEEFATSLMPGLTDEVKQSSKALWKEPVCKERFPI